VSRRTERVADLLREELARVLRREAHDPRLARVTVTRVEVSADLGMARVFFGCFEDPGAPEAEAVEAALAAAAPFLRRRLAESLELRRIPQLDFRFDAALAGGDSTLALLREIGDAAKK
jgi:ribosome-binding factor A